MLVYFFKLIILIWLFFLQNVYADIKIIDGDTIIVNEKKIRLFQISKSDVRRFSTCFPSTRFINRLSRFVRRFPPLLSCSAPIAGSNV